MRGGRRSGEVKLKGERRGEGKEGEVKEKKLSCSDLSSAGYSVHSIFLAGYMCTLYVKFHGYCFCCGTYTAIWLHK